MKAQGRLDNIHKIYQAREWEDQVQGRILMEEYKSRYVKPSK
jgi:hypothetical protein